MSQFSFRRVLSILTLIAGVAHAGLALSTGPVYAQSDVPPKISFLPVSSEPLVPRGDIDIGNPVFDNGFILESAFSDTFARDGDRLYALFRSPAGNPSGIALWSTDLSRVERLENLTDRNVWEFTHHQAPAVSLASVDPGANGVTGGLSASVIDGDLYVFFKPKRLRQEDILAAGQGGTLKIALPYVVANPADIAVKQKKGSKWVTIPRKSYSITNLGNGKPAVVVLDNVKKGTKVRVQAKRSSRIYRVVSTDGGKTFGPPKTLLNEKGHPEVFGGSSVQKVGGTWYMAHSDVHGGAFLRTSKNGLKWGPKTLIIPLGPEDSGYDHHIVGTTLQIEKYQGTKYFVLYVTGGGGKAKSDDGIKDAHDYPETVHVFRAPVSAATDRKAWEPYRYNPIMMRGSASQQSGGAIWRFKGVRMLDGYGALFEGLGVVPELARVEENVSLVREYEYGTDQNKFGKQIFSQGFVAGWPGKSLMAAWDEHYYDPGRFLLSRLPGRLLPDPGRLSRSSLVFFQPLPSRFCHPFLFLR